MYPNDDIREELSRGNYTEFIYDATCFGIPVDPETAEDVAAGIQRAMELDERPLFLEGLSERLTELGAACSVSDSDLMLSEVKRRYKEILGKACPKSVQNWIRGTVPGITNRVNNYELCYALEMNFQQTAVFFQKHFLTLPFNVKSREDAVFCYCLYHQKPYAAAAELLQRSKDAVQQAEAHTDTAVILSSIMQIDNDDAFLEYLLHHCYGNQQMFQLARSTVLSELELLKCSIRSNGTADYLSPDRLNSTALSELLGYKYQSSIKNDVKPVLPKRFTESLPNDVTLGKIINGDTASYELLRKTLMLLRFYNFYNEALNTDINTVANNLLDFYEGLNSTLIACGFAQIYVCHPFDCLLLYCANSYDPIQTMHLVNERN